MLERRNVSEQFLSIPAVSDVSFTARAGGITGYFGPNGSGKSATMKVITGLMETVERLCAHVVILHRGKVVADDSISNLRTPMEAPTLEAIYSRLAVEKDTAAISRETADLIEA